MSTTKKAIIYWSDDTTSEMEDTNGFEIDLPMLERALGKQAIVISFYVDGKDVGSVYVRTTLEDGREF